MSLTVYVPLSSELAWSIMNTPSYTKRAKIDHQVTEKPI